MKFILKPHVQYKEIKFKNIFHFLFLSNLRNEWIYEDFFLDGKKIHLEIYMRKSIRFFSDEKLEVIDLSNIKIDLKSCGIFTLLVEELKSYKYPIYFESVINYRLCESFLNNKKWDLQVYNGIRNFIWIPK